jgi:3-hydroxyacyl-[acyl-carrier-protein] dehydratase
MGEEPQEDMLYILVGVDKVKFKKQVVPGDQLELYAEVLRHKGKLWIFKTEARVDGRIAASAEIKCAAIEATK